MREQHPELFQECDFEGEVRFKWGRIVTSGISGIIFIHFILSFVEELGELVRRLAE